jgi:hypothetical protein
LLLRHKLEGQSKAARFGDWFFKPFQ